MPFAAFEDLIILESKLVGSNPHIPPVTVSDPTLALLLPLFLGTVVRQNFEAG